MRHRFAQWECNGGQEGVSRKMNVDHLLAGELLYFVFPFSREKACQIDVSFFFSSRVRLEGKNLIVSYSIFSFTGEGGGIGSLFLSYIFFLIVFSC